MIKNLSFTIDGSLEDEDLIESIYECTQVNSVIKDIVVEYFKPRFDTNSNSYFQSEEFALRVMKAREKAIRNFSYDEKRDQDAWDNHFSDMLAVEFYDDFCDFHHTWLTENSEVSENPDLKRLVAIIQKKLSQKGYDEETIMLVDDLKINALINMAEELDTSKVQNAINQNLMLEMVYIPDFEYHSERIESTALQHFGDCLSPVSVVPNYNFARLLKLTNISSIEYKKHLKDFFYVDIDKTNDHWINFRSVRNTREESLLHISELMSIIEFTPNDSTAIFACYASIADVLKVHPDETMIINGGFIGLYDFKDGSGVLRPIDPSNRFVIAAGKGTLLPSRLCNKDKQLYNPIAVNLKIPSRFMEAIVKQTNDIEKRSRLIEIAPF